ncbi:MAG TPA: MBL fold metallo-hydrolase [Phenylobacterium sp.]|jgi:ribonuclease Z|uniref:MBL fold metallo-hydrolase n=1 Tax=Phenylobacterium sp. TaxID=1871053 RepID=UPI002C78CA83|nr:MBL fold metallo-hydrolase [Phenylobacterium sp.]HXA38670.1 MBL fold metallo-hydrolase [Phenylobacterium sp.]
MDWRAIGAAAAAVLALWAAPAAAQPPAAAAGYDGLKVTFCGTSGPLPVKDRAKACVAIQAGDALYMVDVGPESTENMLTWRMPMAAARAVFLTHLHSDHIGEVGEFNLQSWVAGRPAPLALVGPPGTEKVAAGFNEAYGPDHGFRNAHHEHGSVKLPIAAGLLKAQVVPVPAGGTAVVWSQDGLTVTAIVVHHNPVTPAYGYRFDYKGRSVVVSGDTIKWPPLAAAAKGADVLIHEAQNADMTRQMSQGLAMMGNPRMSSIMADTLSYHTTPVEAADIARMAGVKRLVLYHITQAGLPMFTPEAFTKGMDAGGPLDWRISKDGMTIELPANGQEIRFGQF